jgi:hypothetical protein
LHERKNYELKLNMAEFKDIREKVLQKWNDKLSRKKHPDLT